MCCIIYISLFYFIFKIYHHIFYLLWNLNTLLIDKSIIFFMLLEKIHIIWVLCCPYFYTKYVIVVKIPCIHLWTMNIAVICLKLKKPSLIITFHFCSSSDIVIYVSYICLVVNPRSIWSKIQVFNGLGIQGA